LDLFAEARCGKGLDFAVNGREEALDKCRAQVYSETAQVGQQGRKVGGG